MNDFREFKHALIGIAREAGKLILEYYQDESTFENVDVKADDSPLTLADKAANDFIEEKLRALYDGIPILSEEGKEIPFEERRHWKYFWLVDPLDGTKEFIKRNGEFTVNIALVKGVESIAGVVHVPVSGDTYFGMMGMGAFKVDAAGMEKAIEAQTFSKNDERLRLVVSRSHISTEVREYIKQFEQPVEVAMGSSLKFMLLAEGKADLYPRLGPTMEWDTAAAQAILEAAGGSIQDHTTSQKLRYNKESLINPYFIASGAIS